VLRLDLFKEPAHKPGKDKIIDVGSFTGLFFTLFGLIAMLMCVWFVTGFYDDYTPFLLVSTGGNEAAGPYSELGANNNNIIRFETNVGQGNYTIVESTNGLSSFPM
jgi:hypothetical protein